MINIEYDFRRYTAVRSDYFDFERAAIEVAHIDKRCDIDTNVNFSAESVGNGKSHERSHIRSAEVKLNVYVVLGEDVAGCSFCGYVELDRVAVEHLTFFQGCGNRRFVFVGDFDCFGCGFYSVGCGDDDCVFAELVSECVYAVGSADFLTVESDDHGNGFRAVGCGSSKACGSIGYNRVILYAAEGNFHKGVRLIVDLFSRAVPTVAQFHLGAVFQSAVGSEGNGDYYFGACFERISSHKSDVCAGGEICRSKFACAVERLSPNFCDGCGGNVFRLSALCGEFDKFGFAYGIKNAVLAFKTDAAFGNFDVLQSVAMTEEVAVVGNRLQTGGEFDVGQGHAEVKHLTFDCFQRGTNGQIDTLKFVLVGKHHLSERFKRRTIGKIDGFQSRALVFAGGVVHAVERAVADALKFGKTF